MPVVRWWAVGTGRGSWSIRTTRGGSRSPTEAGGRPVFIGDCGWSRAVVGDRSSGTGTGAGVGRSIGRRIFHVVVVLGCRVCHVVRFRCPSWLSGLSCRGAGFVTWGPEYSFGKGHRPGRRLPAAPQSRGPPHRLSVPAPKLDRLPVAGGRSDIRSEVDLHLHGNRFRARFSQGAGPVRGDTGPVRPQHDSWYRSGPGRRRGDRVPHRRDPIGFRFAAGSTVVGDNRAAGPFTAGVGHHGPRGGSD